jgi:hypothetical protein
MLEILINKEKIDFTLEKEKSLGEVINAIENWFDNPGYKITSLKVDDRELSEDPGPEWQKMPLIDIKKLDIQVQLPGDINISRYEIIISFLNSFIEGIISNNAEILKHCIEEYRIIIHSLKKIFNSGILLNRIAELDNLLVGSTPEIILSWPDTIKEKVKSGVDMITSSLETRINEIANPVEVLIKSVEGLQKSSAEIGEVSLLLQTGKDKQAMEYIINFSYQIEKILRLFTYIKEVNIIDLDELRINGNNIESFFSELNNVLKELIEAFIANDSVLIGDLLEYETAPRLENLASFINKIKAVSKK